MLADAMQDAVLGSASIASWLEHAPSLTRHFFNSPRKRSMQAGRINSLITRADWAGRDSQKDGEAQPLKPRLKPHLNSTES